MPGECDRIDGLELIGEMVHMGQELPTRSMRSNPATYLKIYDDIRKLFAASPEARRLGVQARHFSFNVTGGRCEKCSGTGTVTIEMHFMADLEVKCDACDGRRFQSHILAIKLRNLTEHQPGARSHRRGRARFFVHHRGDRANGSTRSAQSASVTSGSARPPRRCPAARRSGSSSRAFCLADLEPAPVGRRRQGVCRGCSSSTSRPPDSPPPTSKTAAQVLNRLVTEGNTLVVIEHNLEFIANADYVIDLGPGGGDEGGRVLVTGAPLNVAACEKSATGRELRRLFGLPVEAGTRAIKSAMRLAAQN